MVYEAEGEVKTTDNDKIQTYIGVTANEFKTRYRKHNELEIFHNELGFSSFINQIYRSLCRQRVGVYVNKPLTSSH